MLRRIEIPLEAKAAGDAGEVEGYGSIFGKADQGGDVVAAGAFAESLKARMPKMLWQHDPGAPIGIWQEAAEDETGLRLKGRILTETERGRDAHAFVKAGAITGLSIGYRTLRDTVDRKSGIRTIHAAELWEVSLVTFPMQEAAQVIDVKSIIDMTERDIERALRDAGLSARESKAVVSRCMTLGAARDASAIREAARIEAGLGRLLEAVKV